MLLGSACVATSTEPAPQAQSPLRATVALRADGVSLVDVERAQDSVSAAYAEADEGMPVHPLRWTFKDRAGVIRREGYQEDPRWVSAEFERDDEVSGSGTYKNERALLQVDVPSDGSLEVFELNAGEWKAMGQTAVSVPAEANISDDALLQLASDVVGPFSRVGTVTNAKNPVRILFLPEGFQQSELPKFRAAIATLLQQLSNKAGFAEHPGMFEAYSVDIRSQDSGISDPAAGISRRTAFDVAFGNGVARPRRALLISPASRVEIGKYIARIVSRQKPDVVVYIANTPEWAGATRGAATGNFASASRPAEMVITLANGNHNVLGHEMGHALLGLADEYSAPYVPPPAGVSTSCAQRSFSALYPAVGSWSGLQNTSTNLARLPWADLLTTQRLPTPVPALPGVVGAFEGADYCEKGVYRAQANCMMRVSSQPLCIVCQRQLQRFLDARRFEPAK